MPRYFMHLRDGAEVALDEEGTEHADLAAMQQSALASARDCIAGDAMSKGVIDLALRIDVEDEAGTLVYRLPFAEAVSVVRG
jgi:hypothetical protein